MQQLLDTEYRGLVNMLARGSDIGEIESYAHRIMGNPMIITDESYKVLAYTRGQQIDDPVWNSIVSKEYSTSALVEQTDVNSFWERLERSTKPLFVDDKAFEGLIRRAVARIRVGSETKGYIALLEANKPISDLDLCTLQMLAEVLGLKIKEKDTVLRATGQLRDEFSADLLTGRMANEQMIENRARSLRLHFGEWNWVLCVQPDDGERYISDELESVYEHLCAHCNLSIFTFSGSEAFFIISADKREAWEAYVKNGLAAMLCRHRLLATVSLPVRQLASLNTCYRQVERINSLLPHVRSADCSVYEYRRLAPLVLLHELPLEDRDIALPSQAFLALQQADSDTGSEYIDTLRNYFTCNQNVGETARKMFIHRNTINYRLSRIRDLLDDDFDDWLVRLHLHLSILSNDLSHPIE